MTKTTEEILAERKTTHGEYADHARCTQALIRVLQAERGWPTLSDMQKESLHMIAHKQARIVTGNPDTADHWDDIAGYSKLISQRLLEPTQTYPSDDLYSALARGWNVDRDTAKSRLLALGYNQRLPPADPAPVATGEEETSVLLQSELETVDLAPLKRTTFVPPVKPTFPPRLVPEAEVKQPVIGYWSASEQDEWAQAVMADKVPGIVLINSEPSFVVGAIVVVRGSQAVPRNEYVFLGANGAVGLVAPLADVEVHETLRPIDDLVLTGRRYLNPAEWREYQK